MAETGDERVTSTELTIQSIFIGGDSILFPEWELQTGIGRRRSRNRYVRCDLGIPVTSLAL